MLKHNNTVSDKEPKWSAVDKKKLPRIAYADQGEKDKKSSWKYPHHWVKNAKEKDGIIVDGEMFLSKSGLNAAWAAAQGAHTGKKASKEVINHLEKHRKALGIKTKSELDIAIESLSTRRSDTMSKFKTLVRKEAIKELLCQYGQFLLKQKIALSVAEAMKELSPILTILTDNGELGINAIDEIRQDIKDARLVQAGTTFKTNLLRDSKSHLIMKSVKHLLINNEAILDNEDIGIPEDEVVILKEYIDLEKAEQNLKLKIRNLYQSVSDSVIKDILGVYKTNFNVQFVNKFI